MSKRVLVTGAAGFIGSHTVEALLARGDEVVGIDNLDPYYDVAQKRANLAEIQNSPKPHRFSFIELDIRDQALVRKLFEQTSPEVVIHLAAMAGVRASIEQPHLFFDVNIGGTLNLLDAARTRGLGHFVFASTSSVYGNSVRLPFHEDMPADRQLSPLATADTARLRKSLEIGRTIGCWPTAQPAS